MATSNFGKIRDTINKIQKSRRSQHDGIKLALRMLCDEIEKLSGTAPTQTITHRSISIPEAIKTKLGGEKLNIPLEKPSPIGDHEIRITEDKIEAGSMVEGAIDDLLNGLTKGEKKNELGHVLQERSDDSGEQESLPVEEVRSDTGKGSVDNSDGV